MANPLPQTNFANVNAAINGMTGASNRIAQDTQAYHNHLQALSNELTLLGNMQPVQMQQQFVALRVLINEGIDLSSAR